MNKSIIRAPLMMLCAAVIAAMAWVVGPARTVVADTGSNWTGQYWNNNSFTGNPALTRTDPAVNFNWGAGSPDPSLPAGNFSVQWTLIFPFAGGTYLFRAGADGGIQATVDTTVIINQLHTTSSFTTYTAQVNLAAGNHQLTVKYTAQGGLSGALFDWLPASAIVTTQVPGSTIIAPTVAPTLKGFVRVDVANVRGDPSTVNPPITQVFFGDIFPILAANNGNNGTWFLIRLPNGQEGWMARVTLYLYNGTTDTLPITQATVTPQGQLANVQATAFINVIVRDGPSVRNAKKIGAIPQGTTVQVLALSRNHAWVLVSVPGLQGWVFDSYLIITVGDLGDLPVHN
ncbi:MAG: SH3 domain-containing protein [Aggregatilineales bacterium]